MRKSYRSTAARAHIEHAGGPHIAMKFGKRPHFNDPSIQVPHQNEPTEKNPVSQHKQFKGHSTSAHASREPK